MTDSALLISFFEAAIFASIAHFCSSNPAMSSYNDDRYLKVCFLLQRHHLHQKSSQNQYFCMLRRPHQHIHFSQSLRLQPTLPLLTECLRFFISHFFNFLSYFIFFCYIYNMLDFLPANAEANSQPAGNYIFQNIYSAYEIFYKNWLKTYTKRQKCNILLNKKGGLNNAKNQSNSSYRRN